MNLLPARRDSGQTPALHQCLLLCLRVTLLALASLSIVACTGNSIRPDDNPDAAVETHTDKLETSGVIDDPESPAALPSRVKPKPESEPEFWARLMEGFAFSPASHQRIDAAVRRWQRSPDAFYTMMSRGVPYLYRFLEQVEQRGLPSELALLPAVESGFISSARSRHGAAGLWQIMPATGSGLGLKRDWWTDERLSVDASTAAALRYLEQLNARFDGDWLLALAAYNAGSGRVGRAIQRSSAPAPTYWSLDLPRETDQYVPRLLALVRIIRDPEHFGLRLPAVPNSPVLATVDTESQIDLQIAAGLAGMPVQELRMLNAQNRRWASPPSGPHQLLLPTDRVADFSAGLATLPASERLRWKRYEIQPGDSLIRIGRRHNVPADAIKQANRLRSSRIRAGDHLLIPLSEQFAEDAARIASPNKQRKRYRVRKGDSLYKIAALFDVTVKDLRRWNQVGRYIQPGQKLTVYVDPGA